VRRPPESVAINPLSVNDAAPENVAVPAAAGPAEVVAAPTAARSGVRAARGRSASANAIPS